MMRPADDLPAVYLCATPVDFRKGMHSLAVMVENDLQRDPFMEGLFVFCNRPRTSIKMLYWARNGFCLWQKRLEKERFFWPRAESQAIVELTVEQLNWLLDGYDIRCMKPHKKLNYRSVL